MSPVYIALDFPTLQEAQSFLEKNNLQRVPVKVGMELFYREGFSAIESLKNAGHNIFLDLKLHDIPTTVKRTMRNLRDLEVDFVNVHALGGKDMIARAKEGLSGRSQGTKETKLLAVTLLTSMDEATMHQELTLAGTLEEKVVHFGKIAYESGADGVVCSVHEVEQIKRATSAEFLAVTPGIRLQLDDVGDQKRVANPIVARRVGADALVIGRSITKATHPKKAYKQALKEWKDGLTNGNY